MEKTCENCCKCGSKCNTIGTQEQYQKLQEAIERYKDTKGALIPVLHCAQDIYGYIPYDVQREIAHKLSVPLCEIYGVVTFYSRFSLEPKGEYKINVCTGTACYVRGAQKVLDEIEEVLGIKMGHCTEDGKFSLDATRCVGACGLAPVVLVNEEVHGKMTPKMVEEIINKYKNQ